MSENLSFLINGSYSFVSFVIALSIIVFIHEFGHYIVGRWCGIKAEVFSIGFGPVLFSKNDKHGTKWQIALLPLGGFVKFFREEGHSAPDYEKNDKLFNFSGSFEEASVLSRALTVLAGPLANFILTFVILVFFIIINGVPSDKIRINKIIDYPFETQNLRTNDKIISINGHPVRDLKSFYELSGDISLKNKVRYSVERNGSVESVFGPHPFPPVIGSVSLRSAASESGLRKGDLILKVNEFEIFSFLQLQSIVANVEKLPLRLKIWRDGKLLDISVIPKLVDYPDSNGSFTKRRLIGISGGTLFEFNREIPSLFQASKIAINQIVSIITGSLNGIKNILLGAISTCNLQGPIGIASTAGEAAQQGVSSFIWLIAILSTAIGMLNLFPIPMLDGGHLIFFGLEAITRRKPSEKLVRGFSFLGVVILMLLMLTAIGSDLFCP